MPADLEAAERAAADFLTALGIDIDREERRATPARMARAYADLFATEPFRLTTFPNDGYDELVLASAIRCAAGADQQRTQARLARCWAWVMAQAALISPM